jgi:hypothetical protein
MRKHGTLAAAVMGIVGISANCASPPSPGAPDPVDAGVRVATALLATAAAKKTPVFPYTTPTPEPPPPDSASLDLLLRALYEGISHRTGSEPDWKRLESLFVPGATLMPPRHPGDPRWRALTFEEFRQAVREGIADRREQGKPEGFIEREIGRQTEGYGTVTVVLSAYDARFEPDDSKPFLRGVNSIQVVRAGNRWAILSIAWDTEGPNNPIPERLLRGP